MDNAGKKIGKLNGKLFISVFWISVTKKSHILYLHWRKQNSPSSEL